MESAKAGYGQKSLNLGDLHNRSPPQKLRYMIVAANISLDCRADTAFAFTLKIYSYQSKVAR
jgi:hypothetical protein